MKKIKTTREQIIEGINQIDFDDCSKIGKRTGVETNVVIDILLESRNFVRSVLEVEKWIK